MEPLTSLRVRIVHFFSVEILFLTLWNDRNSWGRILPQNQQMELRGQETSSQCVIEHGQFVKTDPMLHPRGNSKKVSSFFFAPVGRYKTTVNGWLTNGACLAVRGRIVPQMSIKAHSSKFSLTGCFVPLYINKADLAFSVLFRASPSVFVYILAALSSTLRTFHAARINSHSVLY